MDFKSPSNDFDALVLALQLAITAPDDATAQECVNHAEQLAQGFSEIDVERAKRQAYETTQSNHHEATGIGGFLVFTFERFKS